MAHEHHGHVRRIFTLRSPNERDDIGAGGIGEKSPADPRKTAAKRDGVREPGGIAQYHAIVAMALLARRTVTREVSSAFCQTATRRMSPGPMRYCCSADAVRGQGPTSGR